MHGTVCASLAAAVVLGLAPAAASQTVGRHTTMAFSDSSRPGTLRVNVFSGSIAVTVGAGREVVIDAKDDPGRSAPERSRRPDRTDSSLDGLHRLTPPAGLAIEEQNNVITISSPVLAGRASLDIQVPPTTNLVLRTVNGGDVRVEGITGSTEVNSVNGSIHLTNVSGSVVAHAMNGKVVVSLRQVVPGAPMAFTSFNGDVDVTLPASAKANLKLRSDRGDVYTDFDVQTRPAPASAATQTPSASRRPNQGRDRDVPAPDDLKDLKELAKRGAKYDAEIDRSIYGTINGGGPDFELRTFNGNVVLRTAK